MAACDERLIEINTKILQNLCILCFSSSKIQKKKKNPANLKESRESPRNSNKKWQKTSK